LLHLLFTCRVQANPEYLETLMHMLIERRLAEDRSPHHIYAKRCDCVNTSNRSPSLKRLKRLDVDTACGIFNAKLSNPGEWTLVLVGKLPPTSEILPLLERYVATIPAKLPVPPGHHPAIEAMAKPQTSETLTPLQVRFPASSVPWEEVRVPMVDAQCRVLFSAPLHLELATEEEPFKEMRQMLALTHLWHLLETRLCERLRFELGKTYKVSIGDSFEVSPPSRSVPKSGCVSISFGCEPGDAREMLKQVQAAIEHCREKGFELREVDSVRAQERLSFDKALRENGFWETTITNLYFSRSFAASGFDIGQAVNNWKLVYDQSLRNLSPESARETLQRALPKDGVHTVVVMMPQARSAPCAIS